MTTKAIDCATQLTVESATELKNEGISLVGRYLGHSWKGLSANEVAAIEGSGIKIFSIYETSPTKESYFSYDQGKEDAAGAIKFANEIGQPSESAIYFTVDFDAQAADMAKILDYFNGVNDGLNGSFKVGSYGEFDVIEQIHAHGLAQYYFQTYAWSKGEKSKFTSIYQYKNGQQIAGIGVDLDEIDQTDVGAWGADQQPKEDPKPVQQVDKPTASGTYAIKSGDTFWDLEQKHKWESGSLQKLNPGVDPSKLQVGQVVKTPTVIEKAPEVGGSYTIKKADNFWIIENKFGWPHGTLVKLNPHLNPNALHEGVVIHTPGHPDVAAPKQADPVYHVVEKGDTVSEIAAKFGTTTEAIDKLNPSINKGNIDEIFPGQKIRVK